MSEDQLVVTCSVSQNSASFVPTYALINTGASGYAFVDQDFATKHGFALTPLKKLRLLEVIDGRLVESGRITHIAKLSLDIHGRQETAPFFVNKLGHYPIVMGIPWMRHHDLALRPKTN